MDFLRQSDGMFFEAFSGNHQSWPVFVVLGIFCAKFLIYVIPVHLCILWFFFEHTERQITLSICVSICSAIAVGHCISLIYFSPRPFVVYATEPLIRHAATASFPSTHALVIASYTFVFYFYRYTLCFRFGTIFLFLICWGRVFTGVHYVSDVVSGVLLGALISWGVNRLIAPYFPDFLYQIPPLKYNFRMNTRSK